jgi:hypothetical protein
MSEKRVFKTKAFARWVKKVFTDEVLCKAAREIEKGLFEADLGGGVCKKRIALPGKGKSGSTRTLVAVKHKEALFFLVGRGKSDPGTDFSDKEEDAAKLIAKGLNAATMEKLELMKADGVLLEIGHAKKDK